MRSQNAIVLTWFCLLVGCSGDAESAQSTRSNVSIEELGSFKDRANNHEHYDVRAGWTPREASDGVVQGAHAEHVPALVFSAKNGVCDAGDFVEVAKSVATAAAQHGCNASTKCARLFCIGAARSYLFMGVDPALGPLWSETTRAIQIPWVE